MEASLGKKFVKLYLEKSFTKIGLVEWAKYPEPMVYWRLRTPHLSRVEG
jgi:hypothetical protein